MKKRTLVIIHGGEVFKSKEDFYENLEAKTFETSLEKRWKDDLAEAAKEKYEVLYPVMPLKQFATYRAWDIWFNKIIPHLQKETVLVGHSLGASFLVKWLCENTAPFSIASLHLVSVAASDRFLSSGTIGDFSVNLEKVGASLGQAGDVYLYSSTDDEYVLHENTLAIKEAFPAAIMNTFSNRGHFFQAKFPEIKKILGL